MGGNRWLPQGCQSYPNFNLRGRAERPANIVELNPVWRPPAVQVDKALNVKDVSAHAEPEAEACHEALRTAKTVGSNDSNGSVPCSSQE